MSKIRIYAKKSFALGPGAVKGSDKIESVVTTPMSFMDIDERLQEDLTFKLAVKAGEIIVVNKATMVQNDGIPVHSAPVVDAEITEEVVNTHDAEIAEFKEKLKAMNAEEVEEAATQYNAQFVKDDKLKENKKRVLAAYKLQFEEEVEE